MAQKGKWISLAITLALMALIFFFSAQPGTESSLLSNRVTEQVECSPLAKAATPRWFSADNLNANLRKWAHFYIYCVLGVSMAVTIHLFGNGKMGTGRKIMVSAALCAFYAASDEIHQQFVPGRAAMWQDVLLDSAGFLPCLLLTYGVISLAKRFKNSKTA